MKKVIFLFVSVVSFSLHAQNRNVPPPQLADTSVAVESFPEEPVVSSEDEKYPIPQEFAQYKEGKPAMSKVITQNLVYPNDAARKGIQGTVIVTLYISSGGKLEDAKVKRGLYLSLDKEALRVAFLLGDWEPAKINGKTVNSKYVLPFKFSLPEEE